MQVVNFNWLLNAFQRIMELPNLIADAQRQANHKEEMDSLSRQMEEIESGFKMEILVDVDAETGKKRYPNQESRDGRLKEILKGNLRYQEFQEQLSKLQIQKTNANIEVERLRNELIALKVGLQVACADLESENIKAQAENIKMSNQNKTMKVEVHHVAI